MNEKDSLFCKVGQYFILLNDPTLFQQMAKSVDEFQELPHDEDSNEHQQTVVSNLPIEICGKYLLKLC